MTTNKRRNLSRVQGRTGGGGQQSRGKRTRGLSGKSSGGHQRPGQGGRIAGQGGAVRRSAKGLPRPVG